MSPWLQLIVFAFIAYRFSGSKTYAVLLIAAAVNLLYYFNTTESTPGLAVGYSVIDMVTVICLFRFGDSIKLYQCSLLSFAAVIHFIMQMDLMNETSFIYDDYVMFVTAITVLQILGAVTDGFYNSPGNIRWDNSDRNKHHYFSNVHGQRG